MKRSSSHSLAAKEPSPEENVPPSPFPICAHPRSPPRDENLLLSGREADSAGYLTAAEILKGQLAGYPTDTYAHNGNEDLDRLQREHPDWSIQLVANGRGSAVTAHRRDGKAAW